MALHFRIKAEGVSPQQAFDYVSDVTRHPEWANPSAKMRMDPVSGGAPHLGAKYRSQAVFVRKPGTATRRNALSEWFVIDNNKIRSIYSAMFYPSSEMPVPNWPPYEGNWPLAPSLAPQAPAAPRP